MPSPRLLANNVAASKRATSFEPTLARIFGEVVRAERVRQQIAQDALALSAGVDRSYYGKLERGERQPSLALMLRIASALGVPASELVARVERDLKRQTGTR